MPSRCAPVETLPGTFSNAYSGVCTPITWKPLALYSLYQAVTWAIARWQLMHEYAQKSTSTTEPLSEAVVSGGEFSHWVMPAISGAGPQSCSFACPEYCAQSARAPVPLDRPRLSALLPAAV